MRGEQKNKGKDAQADRKTGARHVGMQTHKKAHRQVDTEIAKEEDRQADRQADRHMKTSKIHSHPIILPRCRFFSLTL